ncbi:MAG: MMPL family transporter, partial [Propionibacteriaceae bacterium]|nr:MMPL family transporter [Propionibacteriaceae bacterium]
TDTGEGVRRAVRRDSPIIAVAGLCVAGGTIALLAAPFAIFRGLGPALALTVLVSLTVCLTLTPAIMAILGWRLFAVLPVRGSKMQHGEALETLSADELQKRASRGIRLLTARGPALAATVGVVVLLSLAAIPIGQARLDLSASAGLPSDDTVAEGAQLLSDAGVRGISAPTEVFLEQDGVTALRPSLIRLENLIARQPGVVRVLGPGDVPVDRNEGVVLAQSGNAARFVVVYNTDPLAAEAIGHVRHLQAELPTLALQAGFPDAQLSVTGQTVIASEVAQLTRDSLQITLLVALAVELVILVMYLRALVAPVVLLACSVLSVAAALGLTTLVFQGFLGDQGLTFYAPFAAAVLLIALGSDYNVFAVGSIWHEAASRPLAEALTVAVPRTSRAITIAGVILAGTFALVAIIPLATFRQFAFAMTVGMLIDTMVVRPVLTPAVLTLLGPAASWPSHRITTGERKMTQAAATRMPGSHG